MLNVWAFSMSVSSTATVAEMTRSCQQLLTHCYTSHLVGSVNAQKQHTAPGQSFARLAYTTQETASLLGIHRGTLWRLVKRGLIRPSKALRIPLFPRSEIERFLAETI